MSRTMRRLYANLSFPLLLLALVLSGCAGPSDAEMMKKLEGQWLSQGVNASGEKTRITFGGTEGENAFTLEAYKRTSTSLMTAPVGAGKFNVSGEEIKFDFDDIDDVTSQFHMLHDNEIHLDGMSFLRTGEDGQIAGGVIRGQIQIHDGTEQAPTASVSAASRTTVPESDIVVQDVDKGGTSAGTASTAQAYEISVMQLGEPTTETDVDPKEYRIKRADGRWETITTTQTCEELLQDPNIIKCVPKMRMRLQSIGQVGEPGDDFYNRQWGMKQVNALGAWQIAYLFQDEIENHADSSFRTVAVIDTGMAFNPDIDRKWNKNAGYDYLRNSFSGEDLGDQALGPGLSTWHGTHVAGIVGAEVDNEEGVTGIHPFAQILPLRVIGQCNPPFDNENCPEPSSGDLNAIANAVWYAAGLKDEEGNETPGGSPRARVLNLSLGCVAVEDPSAYPGEAACELIVKDSILGEAIQEAINNGVIIVAAAGNCHIYPQLCDKDFYPAAFPGVIRVGGIDSRGVFATDLSHFGDNQIIVAPSGSLEPEEDALGMVNQVLSTVFEGYGSREGTSQAAPFVAGTISLMLSIDPTLTRDEIEQILRETALDMGATGWDPLYGDGVLNARDAVLRVAEGVDSNRLASLPAPTLHLSHRMVNFGSLKKEFRVFVHNAGAGEVGGLSVEVDPPVSWLDWEFPQDVEAAPTYLTLKADRSIIDDGSYATTVRVYSTGGVEEIEVGLTRPENWTETTEAAMAEVCEGLEGLDGFLCDIRNVFGTETGFENTVDIGELQILLWRADGPCGENVTQECMYTVVKTTYAHNYLFEFIGIPDGQYYVMAGALNPEGTVCAFDKYPEVPCTAYPSLDSPQVITIRGGNTEDNIILGL